MRTTPVATLLAGLAVGSVMLVASILATKDSPKGPVVGAAQDVPTASASPAPPSPTPAAPKVNAVWAGKTDGGAATVAISVKDGVAIAYVCDGKKIEIWLQGTAADGKINLTGKNGQTLTGTFGGGKAQGTVTEGNRTWTFTAPTANPPGGLYRTASLVNSARVVCGWIVLADGTQVGVCSEDGKEPEPAPPLNTNGANPVDPRNPG